MPRPLFAAVLSLMVAVPAAADLVVPVGPLVAPLLDLAEALLGAAQAAVPPLPPVSYPSLPGLGLPRTPPLIEYPGLPLPSFPPPPPPPQPSELVLRAFAAAREAVQVLRAAAQATVLGAADGDAGSSVGTPDAVGVVLEERSGSGASVPPQQVEVPGRRVEVATPAARRNITIPGAQVPPVPLLEVGEKRVPVAVPAVGVPALEASTPAVAVAPLAVRTPGADVPALAVRTPPLLLVTPAVDTPPLRAAAPPVNVPSLAVGVDLAGTNLAVEELRGTLYLGPAQVPYSVGPFRVGADDLPPAVPRSAGTATPPADLAETVLLDEPARSVLPSQRLEVPAQEVQLTDGTRMPPQQLNLTPGVEVLPAQHFNFTSGFRVVEGTSLAEVVVPARRLGTPGFSAPPMTLAVNVSSERVAEVTLYNTSVVAPGANVTGPGGSPDREVVLDPFGDLDNLGYVGYGRANDSSLYPFACTALVGCASAKPLLEPWVERVDSTLDAVAARVDGEVVVRV